jgi:hypothetical protein
VTVQQSDAADVIRRVLRPEVTPDPRESVQNLDLVEYQCPNCRERCINPRDSVLAKVGVCLECNVQYHAHGHVGYIAEPRDTGVSQSDDTEDTNHKREPPAAAGGLGPAQAAVPEEVQEVYHVTSNHTSRSLHAHQHCRYLGAAAVVTTSSTTNLPNRAEACSLCWPDGTTVEDIRDEPGDADE